MRLFVQQIFFGLVAMTAALAVILPAFVVVNFLLHEGYIVALVGVVALATLLVMLFARRYKGGANLPPPTPLAHEDWTNRAGTDSS
jgi:hypothetical protein